MNNEPNVRFKYNDLGILIVIFIEARRFVRVLSQKFDSGSRVPIRLGPVGY